MEAQALPSQSCQASKDEKRRRAYLYCEKSRGGVCEVHRHINPGQCRHRARWRTALGRELPYWQEAPRPRTRAQPKLARSLRGRRSRQSFGPQRGVSSTVAARQRAEIIQSTYWLLAYLREYAAAGAFMKLPDQLYQVYGYTPVTPGFASSYTTGDPPLPLSETPARRIKRAACSRPKSIPSR